MSPKAKVIAWIFGILAAYAASVGVGAYRIVSSEMFPLAEKGLAAYLVATKSDGANKPIRFKWWSSWFFKNSTSDGLAQFLLCTSSSPSRCHTIVAYGAEGMWYITVDGNLVKTDK
ncbi:hypothetical protein PMI15_02913 [Polaromonas sp. CF318]|uniref:hypothetical protein n=1 Tax=Polaromonas sp. CF318 TaxID=1144318 RepID=UPI0002713D39|nr:hypothetical protein [Polaromonas sp. CF318]EJL82683.1 hypothetical protein PMI15_02913 [Polaromonas sp. CF318]